jgi:hypothetical protein
MTFLGYSSEFDGKYDDGKAQPYVEEKEELVNTIP